jgi:hypothetical protein
MKKWRVALLLGLSISSLIVGGGVYGLLHFTGRLNQWQSVTVKFRDGTQVQLDRQRSHPLQAEYRRRCAVHTPSGLDESMALPCDPGGGFPLEIRIHADETQTYLVITGADDFALDLRTGKRAFWEDGKYSLLPPDDHRLPPMLDGYLVDKTMLATPMTSTNQAR